MAGIYIHIPFCKQACTYCNFHFSTNLKNKSELLLAIHKEINLRHSYLNNQKIQTIYFGGGTPSILAGDEIKSILQLLKDSFNMDSDLECTLEANPDDLTLEYVHELNLNGINRLSIGIQSFYEEDMNYMHRSHTPKQSIQAIHNAITAGINNLSIDLIYGSPTTSMDHWKKNLDIAFDQDINHLSCYALTVEPKTALSYQIEKKKAIPPNDEHTIRQLEYLMDISPKYDFDQYEISNFSKQGHRSKHNSNYWQGAHYLGLGPGAHSYNGISRQWNIANNNKFIHSINSSVSCFEIETLSDSMKYNEFILTRLRTIEGICINEINEPYRSHLFNQLKKWVDEQYLIFEDGFIKLTRQGKFIADRISADLFYGD